MKLLTNKVQESYEKAKICYISVEKYEDKRQKIRLFMNLGNFGKYILKYINTTLLIFLLYLD